MSKPSKPVKSNKKARRMDPGAGKRTRPRAMAAARTSKPSPPQLWSAAVTRDSNALDLEPGVFTKPSAGAIARSLKRSAERSGRRKTAPFRSAMSMLTFYINRAGRNLPKARLKVLERAKGELRKAFGR